MPNRESLNAFLYEHDVLIFQTAIFPSLFLLAWIIVQNNKLLCGYMCILDMVFLYMCVLDMIFFHRCVSWMWCFHILVSWMWCFHTWVSRMWCFHTGISRAWCFHTFVSWIWCFHTCILGMVFYTYVSWTCAVFPAPQLLSRHHLISPADCLSHSKSLLPSVFTPLVFKSRPAREKKTCSICLSYMACFVITSTSICLPAGNIISSLWASKTLLSFPFFFKLKIDSALIQYINHSLHLLHSSQLPPHSPSWSSPPLSLFRKERATNRKQPNMTKQDAIRQCKSLQTKAVQGYLTRGKESQE